jgi:hypothetical protein
MAQRAAPPPLGHSRGAFVYLLLDAQADLKTVVADLLSGRYRHALCVVAFNTADGGTRDLTAEIARKVLSCAVESDHEMPAAVRDFVERAGA